MDNKITIAHSLFKGIKQSKKLSKLLRKLDIEPDYVISSTTNRCHDTAKQLCKKFDLKLHSDENLYFKGIDPYLADIADTADNIHSLVIVGHNDDLTDLISLLLACRFISIVKWFATVIEFNIESWTEVEKATGNLKHYIAC